MFENLLYFPLHKDVPLNDVRAICKTAVDLLRSEPKL